MIAAYNKLNKLLGTLVLLIALINKTKIIEKYWSFVLHKFAHLELYLLT